MRFYTGHGSRNHSGFGSILCGRLLSAVFLLPRLRSEASPMHVALSRPSLAGLAVFLGWSILVNARDSVERKIAGRLRHPMATSMPSRPPVPAANPAKVANLAWN
jgi:hypothetical protein